MVEENNFVISGNQCEQTIYIEDEDNVIQYYDLSITPYLTSYYVEDEDNYFNFYKRGSLYNGDGGTDVYTRSGGVTCYETSKVTFTGGYSTVYVLNNGIYSAMSGNWYNMKGKEYYTRSNGAYRYTTTKVNTNLYESGAKFEYPAYKLVSKNLYERGSLVTLPAYKECTRKLYEAGTEVAYTPASFITRDVTVLKV